jgi:hypothetical protein
MINCKFCGKEILSRRAMVCSCGKFCSMVCLNKYHDKMDDELKEIERKINNA